MVCSNIIYASIYQLDKYIKLPWWIPEYVPGILSVIFVYLFKVDILLSTRLLQKTSSREIIKSSERLNATYQPRKGFGFDCVYALKESLKSFNE